MCLASACEAVLSGEIPRPTEQDGSSFSGYADHATREQAAAESGNLVLDFAKAKAAAIALSEK